MYVKLSNGIPAKFPYSLADLSKDNPNTSFPTPINTDVLAAFDVYPVTATSVPSFDSKTHKVISGITEKNGAWVQTWQIQELPIQIASVNVRIYRNQLLNECDWTQLIDNPLSPDEKMAWQLYRETLRMIPQQLGFPWNVQWPPEPS